MTENKASIAELLRRVHADERGAVSIETVLIIAAIALPILIFVIKFGWPKVKQFFEKGLDDLEGGADSAATNS
jgi:Flp pilus assembly pilin Flp